LAALFPAAANTIPAAVARATASFRLCEIVPPRLMFATAGRAERPATQSMPAITAVRSAALTVEHADGDDRDVLRHAILRSANGARDVRTVAVAVVRRHRVHEVGARRYTAVKSVWVALMPVSMMYAVTPLPSLGG
jgi:hypothetical protein